MTASDLTPRQRHVLRAIRAYQRRHGYAPTLRELGALLGIGSTNGVSEHLRALKRKGVITWEPKASRTLRVVTP